MLNHKNSSCSLFLASVDVVRHRESGSGYRNEIRWTPAQRCSIIHAHGGKLPVASWEAGHAVVWLKLAMNSTCKVNVNM